MVSRALVLAVLAGCSTNWKDKGEDPNLSGNDDTGGLDTRDDDTGTGGGGGDDTSIDTETEWVDADADGSPEGDDCDDDDPTTYPGAEELCDGRDNNCDGRFDLDEDADEDGIADCEDYCPVYASPTGSGDGRVSDPMSSLQDAIDFAGETACNEVRAYQGTYYENVDWNGWPVNAESVGGPDNTIIDGQDLGSVVTFQNDEGLDARLYGFTVTNGGGSSGAGINISYTSPTIEGNLIFGNVAGVANYLGGGIRIYEGYPDILDNEITENDAGYGGPENGSDGGGINIRGGGPTIIGNLIADNTAGDGGGIWVAYSDAIISNNVISGNEASDDDAEAGGQGGGINVQIAGPTGPFISSNVISDNVAQMFGGGIVAYEQNDSYPAAQITNNTIAFNEVTDTDYGAGVCQWRRTTPVFTNNIIASNNGVGVYSEDDMDTTFTYNLVYGNTTNYSGLSGTGTGNLTSDPKFTSVTNDGDWTNDDFTLQSTSPAINAGDPDIDDADGSRSDMGAYGGPSGAW